MLEREVIASDPAPPPGPKRSSRAPTLYPRQEAARPLSSDSTTIRLPVTSAARRARKHRGTRQEGSQRPEEAPRDFERRQRLPGPALAAVPQGEGAAAPLANYAYRDRKARKGDFRQLWITRINAAARANDITYNRFVQGLRPTRFGCATAGLAGSDAKLEAIRALGAASAVNYRRADFEERLRETAPG